jgi:hypothetical protein
MFRSSLKCLETLFVNCNMGGFLSKRKKLVEWESLSPEEKSKTLENLLKMTFKTDESISFPSYVCHKKKVVKTYDMVPALVEHLKISRYITTYTGYTVIVNILEPPNEIENEVRHSIDNILKF